MVMGDRLDEMTPESRWRVAAKFSCRLPVMYGILMRDAVGETFDRRVEELWCYCGEEVLEIARAAGLKVTPADRLSSSLLKILTILFGPEFRGEILDLSSDRAVLLMKKCPFLLRCLECGSSTSTVFHPCMAFCISATESLNKDFSLRFVRAMCLGDKNCEIRVVKKSLLEKEEGEKEGGEPSH
ncbi:MAG: hypothetical protein LUO82_04150 [Methanomicrobiales archaeon]|nr:hypothetical protein [Methanomicrobiales archaeon]